MIWIIGEYAERIDNADELLESFLDGFQDENTQVQLQLLTAIVKLFLKRPTDTQELVQQVRKGYLVQLLKKKHTVNDLFSAQCAKQSLFLFNICCEKMSLLAHPS